MPFYVLFTDIASIHLSVNPITASYLTLCCVVETGDEDVAHHKVDQTDERGASAWNRYLGRVSSIFFKTIVASK